MAVFLSYLLKFLSTTVKYKHLDIQVTSSCQINAVEKKI